MKVAFWDNTMCVRGTTVAMFDYAYYNKILLGNESIVLYNITRSENHPDVVAKFQKEFKVFGVPHFHAIDPILAQEGVDVLYVIEGGDATNHVSKVCKTVNHCVFGCKNPHGSVYAVISPWINRYGTSYPVVPHMITLPDIEGDMRAELGIPQDATVFGRHGGQDQFDIGYVQTTVEEIARTNPSIYFLFMNTKPFCESIPNIIHIGPIVNMEAKTRFINTCDAMLWARKDGETFGCAIGEFSARNRPVFATRTGDLAHAEFLGDKAFWYDENTLKQMILGFNKDIEKTKDWNAYKEFGPEQVMATFKRVFLD
jgi:hypothetical protein